MKRISEFAARDLTAPLIDRDGPADLEEARPVLAERALTRGVTTGADINEEKDNFRSQSSVKRGKLTQVSDQQQAQTVPRTSVRVHKALLLKATITVAATSALMAASLTLAFESAFPAKSRDFLVQTHMPISVQTVVFILSALVVTLCKGVQRNLSSFAKFGVLAQNEFYRSEFWSGESELKKPSVFRCLVSSLLLLETISAFFYASAQSHESNMPACLSSSFLTLLPSVFLTTHILTGAHVSWV